LQLSSANKASHVRGGIAGAIEAYEKANDAMNADLKKID
jgi:hypothetical protein